MTMDDTTPFVHFSCSPSSSSTKLPRAKIACDWCRNQKSRVGTIYILTFISPPSYIYCSASMTTMAHLVKVAAIRILNAYTAQQVRLKKIRPHPPLRRILWEERLSLIWQWFYGKLPMPLIKDCRMLPSFTLRVRASIQVPRRQISFRKDGPARTMGTLCYEVGGYLWRQHFVDMII